MRCTACRVPACGRCGETATQCAVCQDNFQLVNGSCYNRFRHYWYILYACLGSVVAFVVAYVIILSRRPVVNETTLKAGLLFREEAKLHKVEDGLLRLYSVTHTDLRRDFVAGVGIMLHFNWQFMVLAWTMGVFCATVLAGAIYSKRLAVQKAPSAASNRGYDACSAHVHDAADEFNEMEWVYFMLVLATYVVTFAGCIAFAVSQRRVANRTTDLETTMQHYTITVTGMPTLSGTEPVEDNLKEFFQRSLNDLDVDIVGVSVCWNYTKNIDYVESHVMKEIERMEISKEEDGMTNRSHASAQSQGVAVTSSRSMMLHSAERAASRRKRSCLDPQLKFVDTAFGFGTPCTGGSEIRSAVWRREAKELRASLEALRTSDTVHVVLRTETQRNKALARMQEHPLRYPLEAGHDEQHELTACVQSAEPETVVWTSYGQQNHEFWLHIARGIVLIIIAVILLDIFFYAPYVAYILSMSNVAGMTQGSFLQGTILGLLITVCNQIIYQIIAAIGSRCGFSTKDKQMQFYVVMYTIAVFCNTLLDLATVLVLARGYSADQALKMQIATDSALSAKSVAENPSLQRSIYVQIVMYIFPGCLLLPFLLEPLTMFGGPYMLGKWLVRSREDCTAPDAEACLRCPEFDLSRYGDILINVMLCLITLIFTYRDLWVVFLCLIVSLVWIYYWDRFRFLRLSTRSFCASPKMENTAQWLCIGPCMILAGCLMFRLYAAKTGRGDGFLEGTMKGMDVVMEGSASLVNRETVMVAILFAAFCHFLVHGALLKWLVPWLADLRSREDHVDLEVPYEEVSAKLPGNWFNCNPIFCLRSMYYYQHAQPCVPFIAGKEHLLKVSPEVGSYYEVPVDKMVTAWTSINESRSLYRVLSEYVEGAPRP